MIATPDPNDDPKKPNAESRPEEPNLMAEFLESKFPAKARGFLNPYAAQIVFMVRMTGSSRITADFLSQKFDRKFSRRPVEDILSKVRRGEIVITTEQLAAVAREHPTAQRYAELHPEVLIPIGAAKSKSARKPAAKKAAPVSVSKKAVKTPAKKTAKRTPRKSGAATLKKGTASNNSAKPAARKVQKKKPRSRPDPGPELPGLDT